MRRILPMFINVRWSLPAVLLLLGITSALSLSAQDNPVPFVNQPLVPTAVAPGGPDFTLTVNGTGFVAGATVNWNGSARPTTFASASQLTADIPATDIEVSSTATVTVTNPGPGGGVSSCVFFQVTGGTTQPIQLAYPVGGYYVGGTAGGVAGDFNEDGKLDVAAGGVGVPGVVLLMGQGNGFFGGFLATATANTPSSLAAADLNVDGHLDLAATTASGALSILLGKGDGTFQPHVDYALGSTSRAVAVGDFNGDGALDIACTDYESNTVSILLGNGDGTFQVPNQYSTGALPFGLAVGDFDSDGALDLAVSNLGDNTVSVLLGVGDGTFRPLVDFNTGPAPATVLVVDFDRDGNLDLAIADSGEVLSGGRGISVLLGNGDGTFRQKTEYATVGRVIPVVAADLDGDGNLDLAAVTGGTPVTDTISVLLGNGDGTFQPPLSYSSDVGDSVFVVGDFNQDGLPDFMTSYIFGGDLIAYLQVQAPQVSPSNLSFGDQTLGMAGPSKSLAVINNTSNPLTLGAISVTGTDSADFAETNTCASFLAVGDACKVYVTFTPSALGSRTATLGVSFDAPSRPRTVRLTGNGINPVATLSATSLDFGDQTLSIASAAQTVTLTNSGVGPLTITGISPSGDFAQTNTCGALPATVAEGAQCTISVTFTPTAAGARTGAVAITDNAVDTPQTISLTGTGIPATITLSTTSLNFGDQNVATWSAYQPVTVTNSGSRPLLINYIAANLDFAQTNDCPSAPSTIAAGGNCTINVRFWPSEGGTRTGTLRIYDNASGSPQIVSLTGTGVPPTVTVSPASLDFGDQRLGTTSAAQAVTVTNRGGGPLDIKNVTASGDYTPSYYCPGWVAAGDSCTVNVTFKPTLRGTRTGTLTISHGGVGSPHTVSLTGNGVGPGAGFSPTALNFPDQSVGVTSPPLDVTFTNTGNTVLNITGVLATPPFALAGSTCGATLAASASCSLSVNFTPVVAGTTFGALILSNDAFSSPQTLSLTGTTAVNFPGQPVGQTSVPQSVTLTNMSSITRVISGITTTGDFAASGGCAAIGPGGSCAVSVTFTPTTGGARTGSLLVVDNAPGSPHVMTLRGTGLGPGVSFSAATVNFGSVLVGTPSAAQTVTITNSGNQELSITGISLTGAQSGDFTQTNNCPASLAATASCTASVTFTPTATGARSASLVVADNASGNPHTVALTGSGTDFTLGTQSGGSMSATVTAGGTATFNLQLAPTGFSGTVALACAFQGSTPRGASCSVTPGSVAVNGVDPAPFAVNVATTARAMAAPQVGDYKSPLQPGPWKRHAVPLLIGILMFAVAAASRRRSPVRVGATRWVAHRGRGDASPLRAALGAILFAVMLWAACGGDSQQHQDRGTPAGTYNLTLTATAGGVSKTSTLTLTVN